MLNRFHTTLHRSRLFWVCQLLLWALRLCLEVLGMVVEVLKTKTKRKGIWLLWVLYIDSVADHDVNSNISIIVTYTSLPYPEVMTPTSCQCHLSPWVILIEIRDYNILYPLRWRCSWIGVYTLLEMKYKLIFVVLV